VNEAQQPVSARIAVLAADGRAYAPDDAWVHGDDGFDRRKAAFETEYFHTSGDAIVALPAGTATVTLWTGLEHVIEKRSVQILAGQKSELAVTSTRLKLPPDWSGHWLSADVHVHMNYGGTYRNTPARLVGQAAAEDLDVLFNLIVNKEQRIPDIAYFSTAADRASTSEVALAQGQELHTSYWGHLGVLGLQDHYLVPDFAAYPATGMASIYPTNAALADLAHEQGALVGHVHPFDVEPEPWKDPVLTDSLPVEAALGKLDYYEVLGFSDPRASAAVWYRLWNCGLRPEAAAGTDAMANYSSLRGPVGLNRVYAQLDTVPTEADARIEAWLAALKAGRTMATNGPLLALTVEGQGPGSSVALPGPRANVKYRGFLRSAVPVDHLELVVNGKVARSLRLAADRRSANFEGSLAVRGTDWLLVRAWSDDSFLDTLDAYPYATTNPIALTHASAATHCGPDADYLAKWIDRLEAAAQAHTDYNSADEKTKTLDEIRTAREVVESRR
jgi:hypothetical protein